MNLPEKKAGVLAIPSSPNNSRDVPQLNPQNTLEDVPGESPPQPNLLPRSQWDRGLQFKIDPFVGQPSFGNQGRLIVKLASVEGEVEVVNQRVPWPPQAADFETLYAVSIAQLGNNHGARTLNYEIFTPDGNRQLGGALTVSIDSIAPGDATLPSADFIDPELAEGYVTREYLEAHTHVELQIPDYSGRQPRDLIQVFIREQSLPVYSGVVPTGSGSFTVAIESNRFLASTPGRRLIEYVLYDRAENPSVRSFVMPFELVLHPIPTGLLAPTMPNAPTNLAQAREGALVEILTYDNPAVGDRLQLFVNDDIVAVTELGSGFSFPVEFRVPYPLWMSLVPANGSIKLHYIAHRGISVVSPDANFDYDVRVVGPDPDPQDPNPVNPVIHTPTVVPPVSGTDNQLTPDDADQPATIRIALYDGAKPGDVVTAVYGHLRTRLAPVMLPDPLVDPLEFDLPWATVLLNGPGTAVPLYYEISDGTPEGNHQESASQSVSVRVAEVVELVSVTVPDVNDNGFIACCERPWEGIRIQMKDADHVKENYHFELDWLLYDIGSGFPGTPVEATRHTFAPQTDGSDLADFTFTAAEIANGKVFSVPGSPYTEGTANGYFAVRWRLYHGELLVGNSEIHNNGYSVLTQGGCICGPGEMCGQTCRGT